MPCPANILGAIPAIRRNEKGEFRVNRRLRVNNSRTRAQTSFRAQCPAPLLLREAPGHAAEESLFASDARTLSE